MADYDLTPIDVPLVNTEHRTIKTALPVPESLSVFEQMATYEPRSMSGQPPILWEKAEGSTITDPWGNRWIDWSSGVLITNVGHAHPKVRVAVEEIVTRPLMATYVFPHRDRGELAKMLCDISPDPATYCAFALSTGSEATENCIKLAKSYALEKHGPEKRVFVSFANGFHGRTMGAQLAGGMQAQKAWLVESDTNFIQVPFPDGYKNEDTSFDCFLDTISGCGIEPRHIAGIMTESYQGVGPDFFPDEYIRKLEAFCREHDIVLIMDEVQAGFGRTGKMFTYQHYGIQPDLIACGKGISSSLPLAAVIGRRDIMDLFPPGSMTSTHSASPLAVASGIANLKVLQEEKLVERAARLGDWLLPELEAVQQRYSDVLGCFHGRGLVAGIQTVSPGTRTPDPALALRINIECFHRGLLMFAPVGIAGECVKISPPLNIDEGALRESVDVFKEAVDCAVATTAPVG